MTDINVDRFKTRLLEMQTELTNLDSISKQSTATVVLDQSSVGRLSRMDALQGQQMALEAERRRKQELSRIKAALNRIENDEFGFCASCGDEIAIGRLDINPVVERCGKCSD
jgi:DnaK suppressor protein